MSLIKKGGKWNDDDLAKELKWSNKGWTAFWLRENELGVECKDETRTSLLPAEGT